VLGRQVVRNVEHYIADDTTDRWESLWGDILEGVFVGRRIFCGIYIDSADV
jgi:hypothetical protein